MTLLYSHDDYLRHDTGRHPECADRLRGVVQHLKTVGLWDLCARPDVPRATAVEIGRVHDRDYIRHLQQLAADGGGRAETDTVVSPASYEVALRAVGAVCDATRKVVSGHAQQSLCLVRPPGHHALRSAPMGFCLFNQIAVAAQTAIGELELDRVLIVDWDVHHGNGTQDAFWQNEQVGFYSVHRWPFYPGSGAADETGSGAGLGSTRNLPLEIGISRDEYIDQVASTLSKFADQVRPDLILISAGFDSHRLDPVGSLGLEAEDFSTLTRLVQQIARTHCEGRIVSVLEGGYNLDMLPLCVEQHLQTLLDARSGDAV